MLWSLRFPAPPPVRNHMSQRVRQREEAVLCEEAVFARREVGEYVSPKIARHSACNKNAA